MANIVAFLLCLATQSGEATPPDLLRSTNPNRHAPLWVAASTAVTPDGKLAREHFESYELRMLQRTREGKRPKVSSNDISPERSCFGESPAEIAAPSGSLKDLANARTIIEGEVTGRTVGFFDGRPGALLSVRVERTVQREKAFFIPAEVLVYFPEADFTVGDESYCIRPATHPARPRIGDRIVVFAYGPPVDTTGRVLYVQASMHLIFETADGRLLPPVALRKELALLGLGSIADVMGRLESDGLRVTTRSRTVAE